MSDSPRHASPLTASGDTIDLVNGAMRERAIPTGYTAMRAEDAEVLRYGAPVLVLDRDTGDVMRGAVAGFTRDWLRVTTRPCGNEVLFDLDDPAYWSEADEQSGRPRRVPRSDDGQFILLAADAAERSTSTTRAVA